VTHADSETGETFVGLGTLAASAGYSRATVCRAMERVKEAGWILVSRTSRTASNHYTLVIPKSQGETSQDATSQGATSQGDTREVSQGDSRSLRVRRAKSQGETSSLSTHLSTQVTTQLTTDPADAGTESAVVTKGEKKTRVRGADVEAVFDHWAACRKKHHPKGPEPKLDKRRRHLIDCQLREGFDVETMKLAVEGIWRSPWHLGQNDRGTEFCDIQHAVGDAAKVEKFAELATMAKAVARAPAYRPMPKLERPVVQPPAAEPTWKIGDAVTQAEIERRKREVGT
jgi:hypothetical protein